MSRVNLVGETTPLNSCCPNGIDSWQQLVVIGCTERRRTPTPTSRGSI